MAEWRAENAGPSGFYLLIDGNDAMGARLKLMEMAEQSIDVQTFLIKPDTAGLAFAAGVGLVHCTLLKPDVSGAFIYFQF